MANNSISNLNKFSGKLNISIEKRESAPPVRYNEASLIEKLNESNIGTPSKLAFILQSLRSKDYIKVQNFEIIPTDKGRIINTFSKSFCKKFADSSFTSAVNLQLDLISNGQISYQEFMAKAWSSFLNTIKDVQETDKHDIIEILNNTLSPVVFPGKDDGTDPRSCPKCGKGILSLKFSRVGTYVTCANAPTCRYTRQLGHVEPDFNTKSTEEPAIILGNDPISGLEVSIKKGRYGIFVQLGIGSNPKRMSLPPDWGFDNVDLETALNFLALPREVGIHPDTGYPIHAGIGRFGPFVLHNSVYSKLNSVSDAFTVDITGAIQAISRNVKEKSDRGDLNDKSQKLGQHSNGGSIFLIRGRLGPFLKYQNLNVKLPKYFNPNSLTLKQAIQLIDKRSSKEKSQNFSVQ